MSAEGVVGGDTGHTVERYEVNQRLALVCVDDPDRQAEVAAAVEALGYRSHVGAEPAEVLTRLRKNSYELALIDEAFQGSSAHQHPVLQAFHAMPMTVRRYVFVALLAPDVVTMDNMTAFARSVNAVVRYDDVPQLKTILERAIADNDQFYRVFHEVLREVGKR